MVKGVSALVDITITGVSAEDENISQKIADILETALQKNFPDNAEVFSIVVTNLN